MHNKYTFRDKAALDRTQKKQSSTSNECSRVLLRHASARQECGAKAAARGVARSLHLEDRGEVPRVAAVRAESFVAHFHPVPCRQRRPPVERFGVPGLEVRRRALHPGVPLGGPPQVVHLFRGWEWA
jgi:hypothetical protein